MKLKSKKEKVFGSQPASAVCFLMSLFLCVLVFSSNAIAQSGGTFTITKSVIAGGGGHSTGGTFTLDGTIGQAVAGTTSTGAPFTMISGFWEGGGATISTRRSPFDFDGDGKTDIGIFRPLAASEWWINRSGNGQTFALQFGASTDKITPADYTGDGKADIAFFRPSSGEWYVLRSEDFSFFALAVRNEWRCSGPG
jgi:hypothetical protein